MRSTLRRASRSGPKQDNNITHQPTNQIIGFSNNKTLRFSVNSGPLKPSESICENYYRGVGRLQLEKPIFYPKKTKSRHYGSAWIMGLKKPSESICENYCRGVGRLKKEKSIFYPKNYKKTKSRHYGSAWIVGLNKPSESICENYCRGVGRFKTEKSIFYPKNSE